MDKHTNEKRAVIGGWLRKTDASLRDAILASGRLFSFDTGDRIYAAGGEGDLLWGVAAGIVRMHMGFGEERLRFCHLVGPGFWFGELEILTGLPRAIEMEAFGPTKLMRLQSSDLDLIAESQPQVWKAVGRLSGLNEALAIAGVDDLMIHDSRKRLAAILLRLASLRWAFQETNPLETLPVTQREVSEAANLSRTVTASILSEFFKLGAIKTEYGRIRILTPGVLSQLLEE